MFLDTCSTPRTRRRSWTRDRWGICPGKDQNPSFDGPCVICRAGNNPLDDLVRCACFLDGSDIQFLKACCASHQRYHCVIHVVSSMLWPRTGGIAKCCGSISAAARSAPCRSNGSDRYASMPLYVSHQRLPRPDTRMPRRRRLLEEWEVVT